MSSYDGCYNCKYRKCYPGDYWTPDEYECLMPCKDYGVDDAEFEDILTRVWENGEQWHCSKDPICPAWERLEEPEEW